MDSQPDATNLTPKSRHTLIAGTGRCGTSLLVKIFNEVGLTTSVGHADDCFFESANAGHELPWDARSLPYIIKSPFAYEWLLKESAYSLIKRLDFAIIPVRDLSDAAGSRLVNEYVNLYRGMSTTSHPLYGDLAGAPPQSIGFTPGGYHFSLDPGDHAKFLATSTMSLFYALSRAGVRILVLPFPEFGKNPRLAIKLLRPFLAHHKIPEDKFSDVIVNAFDVTKAHDQEDEIREIASLARSSANLHNVTTTLNAASHRALFRLYLELKGKVSHHKESSMTD